MKGTEKIIAHIQADAKAQADAILAQSELQCAEIRRSYEAQAKERYGEKIRQGVKACQDNIDSVERINQMEAKKSILALKQEMVSKSFEKACAMLTALPEAMREFADYRMLLYAIVLILVMLTTNNPGMKEFFSRLRPSALFRRLTAKKSPQKEGA